MNPHKLKKIHNMISIAELTAKTNISRQINDVRKSPKSYKIIQDFYASKRPANNDKIIVDLNHFYAKRSYDTDTQRCRNTLHTGVLQAP